MVNARYAPHGSNYHDHLCLCPGCNPQPPDEEGVGIAEGPGELLCGTCGKPVAHGTDCYRCGLPVHWQEPQCGSWLFDSWHPAVWEQDGGNVFWCRACLTQVYESDDA